MIPPSGKLMYVLCICVLEVLKFIFWFCWVSQLKDGLESQKRLCILNCLETMKDYGDFYSWTKWIFLL